MDSNNPALTIVPLLAHRQHVPFVAALVHREFWVDVPDGLSEANLRQAFGGEAEPGRVIASLLALDGDTPVGCVHLIDHDDDKLAALTPWLAAMVVVPERRGEGIGTALVQALLAQARALGFERLWLGSDGPGFYERLGAQRQEARTGGFWILRFEL